MVKGTYPLILLIDFIKTKEMLIQTKENSTASMHRSTVSKPSEGMQNHAAAHSAEHRKWKAEK
jgi:hypothetical protein